MNRGTPLWKVRWLYGVPVACAVASLVLFAEELRLAYKTVWAGLVDTLRLALAAELIVMVAI